MSGTKEGGIAAARTNKAKYGKDFYREIGAKGGRNGTTGGFAAMSHEQRSEAGRKGGSVSKRPKHIEGCTCLVHTQSGRRAKRESVQA